MRDESDLILKQHMPEYLIVLMDFGLYPNLSMDLDSFVVAISMRRNCLQKFKATIIIGVFGWPGLMIFPTKLIVVLMLQL